MHFTHIRLKPTKRIQTNFDIVEATKDLPIPPESKEFAKEYLNSKKTSDQFDFDLMLVYEREFIYGFDYKVGEDKIIIPEINPVTIFYSNAIMSHRKLQHTREELFKESPTVKNYAKPIDPSKFGYFFKLASNCIINLQSALESFANRIIPAEYEFLDKNGYNFKPSVLHKIYKTIPEIENKKFKKKSGKENNILKLIIELRNDIIHLKPADEITNTKYKDVYKRLIRFNFTKAIIAVRNYINFYELDLIEECPCGKEFFYEIHEISKKEESN